MEKTTATADYKRDEQRVHLIVYHLVWRPRRRKPVLVGAVAEQCRALIEDKCAEKGWVVLSVAIQPDHVHLFVQVWPTDSASDVVKECKGLTSPHLRREFPHLLTLPSMWTRSFFSSVMQPTQDVIATFLDAQKGRR